MFNLTKKAAIGAVGVVTIIGGAGGTAWALTSSSTSTAGAANAAALSASTGTAGGSTSSGSATAGKDRIRRLLDRTDHATVELKVKGKWATYDLDRGTVKAVSPTSITLLRPDGQTVTEAITSSTKWSGVTSESSAVVGGRAAIVSLNGDALRIRESAKKATSGSASDTSTGSTGSITD